MEWTNETMDSNNYSDGANETDVKSYIHYPRAASYFAAACAIVFVIIGVAGIQFQQTHSCLIDVIKALRLHPRICDLRMRNFIVYLLYYGYFENKNWAYIDDIFDGIDTHPPGS